MTLVRALAPSALLLCLLLAAANLLVDGPLLAAFEGTPRPLAAPVCQPAARVADADASGWIDPPLRLSAERRREAAATAEEPAEE